MEYLFNFDKLGYLKGGKPGAASSVSSPTAPTRSSAWSFTRLPPSSSPSIFTPTILAISSCFPGATSSTSGNSPRDERLDLDSLVAASLDVLDAEMKPSGYNIGYNMGLAAGASIEHLHLHIIPRYPREIGIAELIAGSRVLVQHPRETLEILGAAFRRIV